MPYILTAPTGDGWKNLAGDELILNELAPGEIALYFYVNSKAVIIGRNQNPYLECDVKRMEEDGVQLVRRVSGGGAVYHDEGNLNYSFIASKDIYDEQRQTGVILDALKSFGIDAEVSGRNDITANGLKFSGNAFCRRGDNCQHHGTLLISAELGVFSNYLTPSKLKLEAKGIKSVRARVCNLNEINPLITVEAMRNALTKAFENEYGAAKPYPFDEEGEAFKALYKKHSSWEWRMVESPAFDAELEGRLSFGNIRLCFKISDGKISSCKLYSDCLNPNLPETIESKLTGKGFTKQAITQALDPAIPEENELISFIREQTI